MRLKQYLIGKDDNYEIKILENTTKFHKHFLSINEFFDKDIDLEKPEWDGTYFTVKFKINDDIYFFKAMESEPNIFGIQFFTLGSKGFDLQKNKKYTGSVFAGVKKSLNLLIKQKKVKSFYFNTDETRLIKLYDRLVKWIEKEFKNYKLTKSKFHKKIKNRKIWIFEKK